MIFTRNASLLLLAALLSPAVPMTAHAQSAGVPIERSAESRTDKNILKEAEKLRVDGKLIVHKTVAELIKNPEAKGGIRPPAPRTTPLPANRIAEIARKACVRIGWYYLCPNCNDWHLNLAGGYAIDDQGAVVTCYHCVKPGVDMREGYLVAVDVEGGVHAVTGVLASNETLDAAVVRIADPVSTPLALQDEAAPGDKAYLFSDPLGVTGYFSSGIINRFYWMKGATGDATVLKDAVRLRFNASTDWAPGSSGSALLDECGNAIGHVSTISALSDRSKNKGDAKPTLITLHAAVPARGVKLMIAGAPAKAE